MSLLCLFTSRLQFLFSVLLSLFLSLKAEGRDNFFFIEEKLKVHNVVLKKKFKLRLHLQYLYGDDEFDSTD